MKTDAWRLNADLHCHSRYSDGVLAPADLVARAVQNGVELLALTDHDELGGLRQARASASELGIRFVAGVEISVTWANETIHVLGLGIDPEEPALVEGLSDTRAGRERRAREIAAQLEAAGVADAWQGALRHVGNPALISRTHFARHLVDSGVCDDFGEVFQHFLLEGKPGFVAHRWARLGEAIGWIRGAGGCAVLAHPARYKLDSTSLWALLSEFRDLGGEAIEVVCGSHTSDQYAVFARHALAFGFKASRGSDFHAPGESRIDIGRLPPLPGTVVPLWRDWP